MGGSLAAICRKRFPKARVIGVSRNRKALKYAHHKRWIHQGIQRLEQGVTHADLIILCTPVGVIREYLKRIDRVAKPGALVTDVGSVKSEIVRWVDRQRFSRICFVGAHPMVGSHLRGITVAQDRLFEQGYTFLTKSPKTDRQACRQIMQFWKKVSLRIVEISPEKHDRIVAFISHLPHVVAACLVLSVPKKMLGFASTGFKETTRVAQGHPSIWLPIFQENTKSILKALSFFETELIKFRRALRSTKPKALQRMISRGRQKRSQISL